MIGGGRQPLIRAMPRKLSAFDLPRWQSAQMTARLVRSHVPPAAMGRTWSRWVLWRHAVRRAGDQDLLADQRSCSWMVLVRRPVRTGIGPWAGASARTQV